MSAVKPLFYHQATPFSMFRYRYLNHQAALPRQHLGMTTAPANRSASAPAPLSLFSAHSLY